MHKLRDTVGHPYSRDTSNQGTQNLVPEKCSHHLCSCYYLYYFKRHLYSAVPKPAFNLHSRDTLALETRLNTKSLIIFTGHNGNSFQNMNYLTQSSVLDSWEFNTQQCRDLSIIIT